MTLPNDVARCHGQTVYEVCTQRETCRRYLEAKLGHPHSWMAAQVPGPCVYYVPRREAPGERSEPVQPLDPHSPTPGVSHGKT